MSLRYEVFKTSTDLVASGGLLDHFGVAFELVVQVHSSPLNALVDCVIVRIGGYPMAVLYRADITMER